MSQVQNSEEQKREQHLTGRLQPQEVLQKQEQQSPGKRSEWQTWETQQQIDTDEHQESLHQQIVPRGCVFPMIDRGES